jgi:hypothetical protein
MNLERAIRLQSYGETALVDSYHAGRSYSLTSQELDKRARVSLARLGVNSGPRWLRSHLKGFWQGYKKANQHRDIIYGRFIGETFYSVNSDRADYYEKHGIDARAFAECEDNGTLGLYWSHSIKPYFLVKPEACLHFAADEAATLAGATS